MRIETGTEHVHAWIDDGIGHIQFDNPARTNALNHEMYQATPRALAALDRHQSVRAVIVSGAGTRSFVSGADISQLAAGAPESQAARDRQRHVDEFWACWEQVSTPVVAMIGGYCLGAGLAVALRADLRICSDDSSFGIPAAKIGRGYGLESVERLLDFVNPGWASEILLTGRRLSAGEALQAGLVTRVHSRSELLGATVELATELAKNAPLSIAAGKAAIREARRDPAMRARAHVAELVARATTSLDHTEGRAAFLEKRLPRFIGR